ncbi:RING finger protein [Isosphaeraceae bacterium EP7]
MELLLLSFLALLAYFALRWMSTARSWMLGGRFAAYRHLASRVSGRYEGRGLYDPPTVSFNHEGSSVRVGLAPQVPGHPPQARTRVVARFAEGIPLRLELAPVNRPAPPQIPRGTQFVRCGDAAFDRAFVIQANDPEMARSFLTLLPRLAIETLARMGPPGGMLLSVNPDRMLVQVDKNFGQSAEALYGVVSQALMVHDALRQGVLARVNQGISIVEVGAPHPETGPPICKVCGEPIDGPSVLCTTCKTPHHADCWEFVGTCSIFGCRGKQATPA